MAVHTKTRRRLKLLFLLFVCMSIAGAIGFALRRRQVSARILRDRDAGYVALEAEDYFTALHKIGPFVQRNQDDPEALFKYAVARSHVEEPNGAHIRDAMLRYQQVLQRQPGHQEARKNLLEIYLAARMTTEIMALTEGRDDPTSLRARAITLTETGKADDALDFATRYCMLNPGDLWMHLFRCDRMRDAHLSPDKILADARELQATHPDDPVFEMTLAYALGILDKRSESLEWARKAAARSIQDPATLESAVNVLNSLEQFDDSLSLLERASLETGDVLFQRRVVGRLYRSGRFEEVIKRTELVEKGTSIVDEALLAHRAMAFIALERYPEAERTIERLRSRKSFLAQSWASFLAVIPRANQISDDRAIINACREGLRGDGENPYFCLYLGDALNRLGENEEAIRLWGMAAEAAPVWSEPLARVIRVALGAGQQQALGKLGEGLYARAPRDPQMLALAAGAVLKSAPDKDAAEVARASQILDLAFERDPNQPLALLLKVHLLAMSRGADEARRFIDSMLQADRSLPADSYLALADAAQEQKLDRTSACFDRCLAINGSGIDLARAKALWLARTERKGEAISYFDAERQMANGLHDYDWQIAWASVLDLGGDDRALAVWEDLAAAWPGRAILQRYIVQSHSVEADRGFCKKAIDQLHDIVGDRGVQWRIAEANWILQGLGPVASSAESEKETVRAASLVSEVTRRYPDQLPARLLLADCMRRLDKSSEAIEQLNVLVRLVPRSLQIRLQLASLLQRSGNFDAALPQLQEAQRLMESDAQGGTPPKADAPARANDLSLDDGWRTLAGLYAARGDDDQAISIMKRVKPLPSGETDLAIAQIRSRHGKLSGEECNEFLRSPTLQKIEIVVENYRRQGRFPDADAALAMLSNVEARAGEKELVRGLYFQRRGMLSEAIAPFRAAVESLPDGAMAWRGLIVSLIMQGEALPAVAAIDEAAAKVKDEPRFAQAAQEKPLIQEQVGLAPIRPLIAAMMDPESDLSVISQALSITRTSAAKGGSVTETASLLRPLADRAPQLTVLQNLVVDLYAAGGQLDDAITVAVRITQLRPADSAPARRASELLAAAGRWREAIVMAERWKNLGGSSLVDADLLIARSNLAIPDFAAAQRQLEPYISALGIDPASDRVAAFYSLSLAGQGRIQEAEKLLEPRFERSGDARDAGIQIAIHLTDDLPTGEHLLLRVSQAASPTIATEHLKLANAWVELNLKFKSEAHREAILEQSQLASKLMESQNSTSAAEWLALAVLREQMGDRLQAELGYRKVLQLDSRQVLAANNLSMLILERGGDLNEALQLAQTAAAQADNRFRPDYLDTVARICRARREFPAAEQAIRQAVRLAPENLNMREYLVLTLVDGGKRSDAQKELGDLELMYRSAKQPPPDFEQRMQHLRSVLGA